MEIVKIKHGSQVINNETKRIPMRSKSIGSTQEVCKTRPACKTTARN